MQLLYIDTYPVSGHVYLPSEVIMAACRLSFHKYTCLQYMEPVYLHYIGVVGEERVCTLG